MKLTAKGAAFIRAHEGFVPRLYLDPVGIPTIGIGFTMRSVAFRRWWKKNKKGVAFTTGATMTRAEADDALRYLVQTEFGKAVDKVAPKNAPQHAKEAACSIAYNAGPGALNWRWGRAFAKGDYETAARLMRTTATTANGKRLPGLVRRRKEEALLMSEGIYTGVDNHGHEDRKANPADDGILVLGERGRAIDLMQQGLAELGFYDGRIDGIFGRGTEAAVMAFQEAQHIAVDGQFGPNSAAAMKLALKRHRALLKSRMATQSILDDHAQTGGDISTTNLAAGLTTAAGSVGAVSQIAEVATEARTAMDTFMYAGPWVLLLMVIAGAGWWIWRERRRKRLEAIQVQELIG